MFFRRSFAVAGLAVSLFTSGCSKQSAPTQPPEVVSGPTFEFTFPAQGVSHEFVFTEAGDWGYDCRPHELAGMLGMIRVRETSTRDSALVAVGSGGLRFNPDTVTIKLNGRIRWVNVSTVVNHTVSRP